MFLLFIKKFSLFLEQLAKKKKKKERGRLGAALRREIVDAIAASVVDGFRFKSSEISYLNPPGSSSHKRSYVP